MTYYKLHLVLRCSLILFSLVVVHEQALAVVRSIHVDLGMQSQRSLVLGWNNFAGLEGTEPTGTLNLIDSTGAEAGITLAPAWSGMNNDTGISGAAADYQGPYPAELDDLAFTALRDGLYVRDGFNLTLTLNNLPANTAYNFLFYGAAANTGDYSLWTVTGSNSGSDFIADLVNNSNQFAAVNGIIPDAMQKISIRFEGRRPDGTPHSPSVDNDGLGRFNYMRVLQHSLVPGDFDANMVVDAADYTAWRKDYGLLPHVTGADGNYDGVVDAADYVLWRKAMTAAGGAAAGSSSGISQPVPEPQAAALAALAMLSLYKLRAGRSRRRLPR